MNITRKERKEMDELSKFVFGATSKWQKIWKNGSTVPVTKITVETVPGKDGAPDIQKEVETPVIIDNGTEKGIKTFKQKYYSLQEIKELMLGMKANIEAFHAAQKKQKEEEEAKKRQEELQKNVQEHLGGSAVQT